MKLFVVVFAIVGSIAAAPQFSSFLPPSALRDHNGNRDYSNIKLVEYEFENHEDGGYHFRYVQDDGQTREETGTLVTEDKTDEHGNIVLDAQGNPEKVSWIAVEGSYSYIDIDDGSTIRVDYKADKGGFRQKTSRSSGSHAFANDEEAGSGGSGGGGGSPLPIPQLPIPIPGLGGRKLL